MNILNLSYCDYKQDQKQKLTCGVPCSWHFWKRIEVIKLPEWTVSVTLTTQMARNGVQSQCHCQSQHIAHLWRPLVCITNDWNKWPPKKIQRKDWTETGCLITSFCGKPIYSAYLYNFAVYECANGACTKPRTKSFEKTSSSINLNDVFCWNI